MCSVCLLYTSWCIYHEDHVYIYRSRYTLLMQWGNVHTTWEVASRGRREGPILYWRGIKCNGHLIRHGIYISSSRFTIDYWNISYKTRGIVIYFERELLRGWKKKKKYISAHLIHHDETAAAVMCPPSHFSLGSQQKIKKKTIYSPLEMK